MESFVITLIAVAVLNGAVGMISPEGDVRKYVRLVGSLCILCVMAYPLISFMGEGIPMPDISHNVEENVQNYEDIYESALLDGGKSVVEQSVKSRLSEKFSLSGESFDVKLILDEEELRVSSVNVYLHSTVINIDPRKISDFVSSDMGYRCEIIYD
jgi:hypothetical protein